MGVKFSAACTVDCTEYKQGVPRELCDIAFLSVTNSDSEEIPSSQQETLFPYPRNSQPDAPSWDISFRQVEGDFQVSTHTCTHTDCQSWWACTEYHTGLVSLPCLLQVLHCMH